MLDRAFTLVYSADEFKSEKIQSVRGQELILELNSFESQKFSLYTGAYTYRIPQRTRLTDNHYSR